MSFLERWMIAREQSKVRRAELRIEAIKQEAEYRNAPCIGGAPHNYVRQHKYETLYTLFCTQCGRNECQ